MNWSLETLSGEVLSSGCAPSNVPPKSSVMVDMLDFSAQLSDDNLRKLVFIAELSQGNQFLARRTAYFVPIKHLSLANPLIAMEMKNQAGVFVLELTSQALALLVEVSLLDADVVFSDNYFNLPSGRSHQISCPLPTGWTLDRAKEAIRLRSVYDSYSLPVP